MRMIRKDGTMLLTTESVITETANHLLYDSGVQHAEAFIGLVLKLTHLRSLQIFVPDMSDRRRALQLMKKYSDLPLSYCDALGAHIAAATKTHRVFTLDNDFRARVGLDLRADLQLPTDTSASIMTSGLLGDQYISLQLGGEEKMLKPGDEISLTESALSLERLIGKLVHSTDVEKKDAK